MQNLKCCPFCGGAAKIDKYTDFPLMHDGIAYEVTCINCNASTDHCREISNAVNLWNERANE